MNFLSSLWKTVRWTMWNTIFGIFPLIAIFFFKLTLSAKSPIGLWLTDDFIEDKIINEGLVMFLCCALMGEVTIDFLLAIKDKINCKIFLVIFSISMLFSVTYIFSNLFFFPKDTYNIELIKTFQKWLIIVSSVFCVIFRTTFYIFENDK